MRYSLQYYESGISEVTMSVSITLASIVASVTLTVTSGSVMPEPMQAFAPFVMTAEDMSPFDLSTMDISPMIVEE